MIYDLIHLLPQPVWFVIGFYGIGAALLGLFALATWEGEEEG